MLNHTSSIGLGETFITVWSIPKLRTAPPDKLNVKKANPASKFRGAISVLFGSQVSLRVHYCKRDEVYSTPLLWQNNGRQNGFISRMLFSDLYKIIEKSYFRRF